MSIQDDIDKLKVELYHALLLKDPDALTPSEVEIGYQLVCDSAVRAALDKSFNRNEEEKK